MEGYDLRYTKCVEHGIAHLINGHTVDLAQPTASVVNRGDGSSCAVPFTPSRSLTSRATRRFSGRGRPSLMMAVTVHDMTFPAGDAPASPCAVRNSAQEIASRTCVAGLSAGQSSTVTVTATRTGYANGSESTSLYSADSTSGTPTPGETVYGRLIPGRWECHHVHVGCPSTPL